MAAVTAEVSAVLVTHNSARYLPSCLASLRQQGQRLHVIVVDNASRSEERPEIYEQDDGEVILNSWNRGFAPAVNQGLARVQTPYVLVLNPDIRLLPEALPQMISFLAHTSNVAAVSPRFWWDTERTVLLPLTGEPTLPHLLLRVLAAHSALVRQVADRWLVRQARRWWFAPHALAVRAISYGCVLLSSAALARIGPLDAQFPFYYEEVEWSQRARRHGYGLFMLPSAEAIHAFGHSSRSGSRRVQRWANVSSRRYWRGRYGWTGARLAAVLSTVTVNQIAAPVHDLGAIDKPPKLAWSSVTRPQVLQVAFDPLFESAAAIFPAGNIFEWPAALWEEMPAGTYHARLLSGPSFQPVKRWRWQRSECDGVFG
jgi:GT2 family glycosyltransferase